MNAPAYHPHEHDAAAERRWRQQMIADLPDAASFAREIPAMIAVALADAYWSKSADALRARTATDAAELRRWGLCDFPGGLHSGLLLTNFGAEVRRHLLAGERLR